MSSDHRVRRQRRIDDQYERHRQRRARSAKKSNQRIVRQLRPGLSSWLQAACSRRARSAPHTRRRGGSPCPGRFSMMKGWPNCRSRALRQESRQGVPCRPRRHTERRGAPAWSGSWLTAESLVTYRGRPSLPRSSFFTAESLAGGGGPGRQDKGAPVGRRPCALSRTNAAFIAIALRGSEWFSPFTRNWPRSLAAARPRSMIPRRLATSV